MESSGIGTQFYENAIRDFSLTGGNLLLVQETSGRDRIGELLGVPTLFSNSNPNTGIVPLYDGPFGPVGPVDQEGEFGRLNDADVVARGGTIAGTNANGDVTIGRMFRK